MNEGRVKHLIERHPRLVPNILFALAIGAFLAAYKLPEKSGGQIALITLSVGLAIAAVMYKTVRLPRTRSNYVIDIAFVLFETSILAEAIAERGSRGETVLLSVIVLLFSVVPLPIFLFLFTRMQDEFQRSLVGSSGAIAFAATLIGVFGYWILQRVDHLAPLPAPAFVVGGAVAWFATWAVMRVRIA